MNSILEVLHNAALGTFVFLVLLIIWNCFRSAAREHDRIRKDAENEK